MFREPASQLPKERGHTVNVLLSLVRRVCIVYVVRTSNREFLASIGEPGSTVFAHPGPVRCIVMGDGRVKSRAKSSDCWAWDMSPYP